jgi:putative ABC transport system ATP-binding protein
VVGPSGSGKSTLIHLIGGVDWPTSGRVMVDGEDVYSLSESKLAIFRRRKVGFVFQSYNLIPVLTAEENIVLPLLLDRKPVDQDYIDELINLLGLSERRRHLPSQLSGGQQQRVSIGRALINSPALVLADEPTGNLNSKNSEDIIDLLRMSNKKYNQTLILVTHDNQTALKADRIIHIEDGRITKDEVIRK